MWSLLVWRASPLSQGPTTTQTDRKDRRDAPVLFHEQLYLADAQTSGLRDYAKTNAREYFADCFDYWIAYSGSEKRMETFRNAAPQTWAYFEALKKNNWRS